MLVGAPHASLLHPVLELAGAVGAGMFGQDALLRAISDGLAFVIGKASDVANNVLRTGREQDLLLRAKEIIKAGPVIGNDAGAASRRLEEPDRGRPTGLHHVATGYVESETRRRIEAGVPARIQVVNTFH